VNRSSKQIRAILRRALLLPILPVAFRAYAALMRFCGLLPSIPAVTARPERILIVNLTAHVGDVVMSLPLLERLHAEHPEASLEMAVAAPMGSFLREIPFLKRVHELDFGAPRPPVLHLYRRIGRILQYAITTLSKSSYEVCLLPRWGIDPTGSAYLAYLTDAPRRHGQDPREELNEAETFSGTRILMTSALRGGHGLPEALREIRLLPASGLASAVEETVAERQPITTLQNIAQITTTTALWGRLGIAPTDKFVVLAPGASAAHRRWPLEAFAETARLLKKTLGLSYVAVGSTSERSLGRALEELSGGSVQSLIGETTLKETIAVLAAARLFIGNDSGPGHVAGGLGIPTLVLSTVSISSRIEGASSPSRVRPVGPLVGVIQPARGMDGCVDFCDRAEPHCILQITPEEVVKRALELLDSSSL
jgi:ADP-heptose:LPS heptosyltransferase